MNTIKLYITESGRIADLKKDFPLYQGQFQNKLLNVYVPTSVLAPDFTVENEQGEVVADYATTTAAKIGITYLARNGTIKKSKNYYLKYIKTIMQDGKEYALYEHILPKEFTTYAGQGNNAPTLVVNIANIMQPESEGRAEILSIITTQTCRLDVMPSAELDIDETIEPTELELINGELNRINEILPTKQNIEDPALMTNSKTVVGSINENKENIEINAANNTLNSEQIAELRNQVSELGARFEQQETIVGQFDGDELPTNGRLNSFVMDTLGREPTNGDVVIFVLFVQEQVSGNTLKKNYKYYYTASGWNKYELTNVSLAYNGIYGLVRGTQGAQSETRDILVDISGGEILHIYIRGENTYRDLVEYLETNASDITDITDGTTVVGQAVKAIGDKLGNDIVNTYLTKTEGATKNYVRDFAAPRQYGSVKYIDATGYSPTAPATTFPNPITTATCVASGSYDFWSELDGNGIEFTVDAPFSLTSSNTFKNSFYISSDKSCDVVYFVLYTYYKKPGENWTLLQATGANAYTYVGFTANVVHKIDFDNPFSDLANTTLTLESGDKIKQSLTVSCSSSDFPVTFKMYSNDVYPSTFQFTSQNYLPYGDVDSELSLESENPVQNKVVTGALNSKADLINKDQIILAKQLKATNIIHFSENDGTNTGNYITSDGITGITVKSADNMYLISSDGDITLQPSNGDDIVLDGTTVASEGFKTTGGSTHVVKIPNTSSLSADKTLATTDEIPSLAFPSGFRLVTDNSTNPSTTLGGTWTQQWSQSLSGTVTLYCWEKS